MSVQTNSDLKILVFGRTGQVAQELQRQAVVTALGRAEADLADPAQCAAAIKAHAPDVVINAAAYTAVDRAEEEEAQALVINAEAPGVMARACAAAGIPLVHISTDYVFVGDGAAPWHALDPVSPQNAYGRTKLAGEQAVQEAGGPHVILRTSWVFSSHGQNFVKTMLRLSETRDALCVVNDQIGGPTPARAIAEACLSIAHDLANGATTFGIYHFSGAPNVSWKDFAEEIFVQAGRSVCVTGIPTRDYPTPARRPLNSRLACEPLTTDFNIKRADWRAELAVVLKELSVMVAQG